ncbi:3-dehydroquinate synthase [Algoriphagus namhaensis]
MNPIIFSDQPAQDLSKSIQSLSPSQVFFICDENSERFCLPHFIEIWSEDFGLYVAKPGESNKNLATCAEIWSEMTRKQLDRKALVVNLGGGVITDMGGFCSSLYKRGIRFINIPTTLLSQVDASVGGKLGVDFEGLKNHLGVFNLPEAVIISEHFLDTLRKEELRSGFAEIMKHGLIQDREYFRSLNTSAWQNTPWLEVIRHSVQIKEQVVLQDPKEAGLRKILNFGHTIGHALETFYLDSANHLLHGEAIAVGMCCEAFLSHELNQLPAEELEEICQSFVTVFGRVTIPDEDVDQIVSLCIQDKKNEGNTLLFSLLKNIGNCEYNIPVNKAQIKQAIHFYQKLSS